MESLNFDFYVMQEFERQNNVSFIKAYFELVTSMSALRLCQIYAAGRGLIDLKKAGEEINGLIKELGYVNLINKVSDEIVAAGLIRKSDGNAQQEDDGKKSQ